MTEQQLIEKYHLTEEHGQWTPTDDWMSVEIFKIIHNRLPNKRDQGFGFAIKFLDRMDKQQFRNTVMEREDWGSLYLTAKRMVYRHRHQIIAEWQT